MNRIDLVLAIILIIGFISGFRKGLIQSASGFIGIGLAIWMGFNFSAFLEGFVAQQEFIPRTWIKIVSLLLTIGLIILAVKLLSKIVHQVVHGVGLGFFNRLGGAVFGFLLYILVLSAIYYYTPSFLLEMIDAETWEKSQILPYLTITAEYMKISFL